jgi:hypothetical protein
MKNVWISTMLFILLIMLVGCKEGPGDQLYNVVSEGDKVAAFVAGGAVRGAFLKCDKLLVLRDEDGRVVCIPYEHLQMLRVEGRAK